MNWPTSIAASVSVVAVAWIIVELIRATFKED